MKSLNTLRDDIYALLSGRMSFSAEDVAYLSSLLSGRLTERLVGEERKPHLRLSSIGKPCGRELWYDINEPNKSEALPPAARLKFLFGDIIEALILFLASRSGHTVASEQKEVSLSGVKGHIDATIDGVLVDVKSASTNSFRKFTTGLTRGDDLFGYLTQLGTYSHALGLDHGAFIAVDKQHGHITVDEHDLSRIDYEAIVEDRKAMVLEKSPPPRLPDEEHQGSGNRKLGVKCSYCAYKTHCWPGLRTFLYSRGQTTYPVYMTRVIREPNVTEVK